MSWKSLDWKYLVMFALTLVGILAPVVWQSVQETHSITVKLLASTTLQPGGQTGIQDLQVSLNGRKIDDPYLSLMEVVNDGSKSILSNDFETPIELIPQGESLIVTAQVTSTTPANITAKVSTEDKRVMIAPYLSNPEDSIFITVITSGGQPSFTTRARIASVKNVNYLDSSVPKTNNVKFAIKIFSAFCMTIMYFVYMSAVGKQIIMSKPLAYLTGLGFATGGGYTLVSAATQIDTLLPTTTAFAIALSLMTLLAGLAALPVSKKLIPR
ncbi:hypothetical protein [Pseudomonas sp. DR48]|uniref:hypothetical protein n=1 Tax=Pseudomonas sp. DR48 TaxID=2871095 RepID=UPI001C992A1A|nr:hypothetical protein [Pseudomonas sp. DR48]QZP34755.1 hypothetical protein K5K95_10325 [Pseudomonas sp. DR48]